MSSKKEFSDYPNGPGFFQAAANIWSAVQASRERKERAVSRLAPVVIATKAFPHDDLLAQEAGLQRINEFIPFVQNVAESAGCSVSLRHTIRARENLILTQKVPDLDVYELLVKKAEKDDEKGFAQSLKMMLDDFNLHKMFFPDELPGSGEPQSFLWLFEQTRFSLQREVGLRSFA